MKPIHRTVIFGIFFAMSLPLAAQSTWSAGTGNWSTAASWSPAGVPASGANIILSDASAAAGTLTLDGATSRAIGSYTHGTTGTRATEFTLQTGTNTLTIGGGVTANGNFTGIGVRLRGNTVVSANQAWSVAGTAGSATADAGLIVQERSAGNRGTLTLNGTLTKSGSGQLLFAGATVDGAGDIVVNEGSLKLNAGSSLELRAIGAGKFILNNASSLLFSKNSGTFGDSTTFNRAFQFNGTANVSTSGTATTSPWVIPSNMEWNGTHNITINNSVGTGTPNLNYQFSGVMSGSGAIAKLGPSQLYLTGSGSNTLSGLVTVTAGELRLAKTSATAIAGNLLVNGGILRMDAADQIADSSNVTVTSGQFIDTTGMADTIASLSISSAAVSSVSGINVIGATTITNGTHDVNSGFAFTTHSLAISNNAALRSGANTGAVTVNVGPGGLGLNNGSILFGNAGGAHVIQLNLSSDVTSSGTSQLSPPNYSGARVTDLQAGSRSFAVSDGTLTVATTVQNGTLVKSGAGLLRLTRFGSTANFSFVGGPVEIIGQGDGGNVSLSGGSVLMDIGGATPGKINATGNFDYTGGTIELTANNGSITPGTLELLRYNGTLTGTPVINIPPQLAASRMNPVVNYGSGTNSAVTITSTAVPLSLVWHGATASGLWDNNTTANFNAGSEKFFPLDSVTFDDSGASASVLLNSPVFPADVVFNHGVTIPTYTLTGTGSISGPTKLTKNGTGGTTILVTDNSYTGATDIHEGIVQVGNGGFTGSLGTGAVTLDFGATLKFSRDGTAVVGNVISGSGTILNSGPGITAFTASSPAFAGDVNITGGTLQLGNAGADGSLGTAPINVASGAIFSIKRTGAPTIANFVGGNGAVTISGGNPNLSNSNTYTGGVTVTDSGVLGVPADPTLGEVPVSLIPNAIRLNFGGLKNQDTDTSIDANRGVTVAGEAYFTAGWVKSLTINGPMTGTGNVFINYDATPGIVRFTDATSTWDGVLTLGAAKPGFSGNGLAILEINTINNGGVAGPLGTASADPANLVFNGGRLTYTGDTASTNRGFTLVGGASLNVTSAITTLTLSGLATGPGAITKVGDGTVVLSGTNDFAGNIVVDDGVISATNSNSLGAVAKTVVVAGDAATNRIPELQVSGGISPTLADLDLSGAGVGNLTGALHNVSGDNTLTVTTDVTLRAGNGGTTLFSSAGTLTLNTPLVTTNTTGRVLTLAGDGNGVINGVIANGSTAGLPIIKNGLGTWTLNGAHTYTGSTTVNAGILSLGQAALNDAAAVVVAPGAKINLNFAGEDRVGSFAVDNLPALGDGLYSATTHPTFITGTGSIRVGAGGAGYASWAAGFPFSVGVNDGPTQDADFDSISNLLEYVLGGIPVGAGSSNTAILPTQTLTANDLILTFKRSDLSEADVVLKVRWSTDLVNWTDFATIGAGDSAGVDVTEDVPTTALDTVVVTIPRSLAPGGKIFARVQAVK